MNVLGIYWGICSGAALFSENRIVNAVSEERYTRIKNDDAFPLSSMRYCISALEKGVGDLDAIALAGRQQGYWYTLKRKAHWSIEDYIREQYEYWYPALRENKTVEPSAYLTDRIDADQFPRDYWQASLRQPELVENFDSEGRRQIVAQALDAPVDSVFLVEHHRCHAYYSYYACPFREDGRPVLSMTIDGWGDGCNATIGIFDSQGYYRRVCESGDANIGRIYRYTTLLLGMKPNEHEYKVMGLAPYCKDTISQKAYEVFKSTLYVDGTEFKWHTKPPDSYFWFKEKLEGCRFDGIAAGLQRWTEELLCQWVWNAVREFGIKDVVLSGGVAMNVKANGLIAGLDEVDRFFVPGTAADDSLAIGAVYALAEDIGDGAANKKFFGNIPHLFLGPENRLEDEEKAVATLSGDLYEIRKDFTPEDIAGYLVDGLIVARCAGSMEFGQRSLCNRSILADPIQMSAVPKINAAIKNRDFWMPFAPVVMEKRADEYLQRKNRCQSPYMTIAFETTDKGWKDMPAACHQSDHSARPQILDEESNPPAYAILAEFEKLTGRGALLNTSFNLHGYPIVNTAAEAIDVFVRSDLDVLVLNNFLIIKKRRKSDD